MPFADCTEINFCFRGPLAVLKYRHLSARDVAAFVCAGFPKEVRHETCSGIQERVLTFLDGVCTRCIDLCDCKDSADGVVQMGQKTKRKSCR